MFTSILILIVVKALATIRISNIHFTRISAIVFLVSGLLILNVLYIEPINNGIGIFSGLFQITNISQSLELFLLIIGFIILIGWPLNDSNYSTDYSLIVLFSALGSSLLISSLDLISLYLSLELQSFGLYILSTLYKDSESSTKAGLKYFLLGGLSSCIILLGISIIYSNTGLTNLESIYIIISSTTVPYIIEGILLGLILIIIGLLFKISAAPLHNWSPDVYDEVPTIVTIWLTIIPKISLLILLLELYLQINIYSSIENIEISLLGWSSAGLDTNFLINLFNINSLTAVNGQGSTAMITIIKNIFLISSILSLIIGTVVGLAQNKIKRLLAYSTISHIGFMLLALSINTEQSLDSFLFYLIQYILTNLNIFLILLGISYLKFNNYNVVSLYKKNYKFSPLSFKFIDIKYISELNGLFISNPFLSICLAISLFSMAGVPPLIGFFSKQFVLYSALESGYYFISIIAIIVSVISASYYLKIIKVLYTNNTNNTNNIKKNNINDGHGSTELPLLASNSSGVAPSATTNIINNTNSNNEIILSQFHSLMISILSLFILLFILKPTLILNSTQVLSTTLFKL